MIYCEYTTADGVRHLVSSYGDSFGCPVVSFRGTVGVRFSDIANVLGEVRFGDFRRWMMGKTCTSDSEGRDMVYLHDWRNFMTR